MIRFKLRLRCRICFCVPVGLFPWVFGITRVATAATLSARSSELRDVQSAVNSARDGDVVAVPAGTATWASALFVQKNLTIRGAGSGKTVLQDSGAPGRRGAPASMMNVQLSKDAPLFRLTGFEFRSSPSANQRKHLVMNFRGDSSAGQKPLVVGVTSNFRLDHCKFTELNGMPATFSNLLGVVDHVEYVGRGDFCYVQHPNWGGHDLGHGSWADDAYWGSNKFLFFEDCDFTNKGTGVPYGFDAYLGARYVVRHCRFHGNTGVTGHGTETPQRGTKQIEIYSNSFDFPPGQGVRFPQLRSGSVLFHDNRFTNCLSGMGLHVYRQWGAYPQWGYSDGRNKWDENDEDPKPYAVGVHTGAPISTPGAEIIDQQNEIGGEKKWRPGQFSGAEEGATYIIKNMSAPLKNAGSHPQSFLINNGTNTLKLGHVGLKFATGDRYEVWKVKTSLDQPGQGKGRLLAGNVRMGTAQFSEGGGASWPQRGFPREPCYAWNNINASGGVGDGVQLTLNSNQHSIKEGRDYFNYGDVGATGQKIGPADHMYGYTPFTYPHPLQRE